MARRRQRGVAILLAAALVAVAGARPEADQVQIPFAASVDAAYRAAYNLDADDALALARRAVTEAPNESATHRTLASILWLQILFRRGAVTIDHYLGGTVSKSNVVMPKPPADLDAEFKREVARAIELAETRMKEQPRSLQARFELGAVFALQASYAASVEGSMTAAFGSARRAYDAQEEVLTRDPKRTDAGVVVGTYRYLVSALNLPTRWLAYVAGFGGDKEKGISLLEAASRHPDTRIDAKTALMLIYSREGRHADVQRIAKELGAEFPRNRLFVLEEGAAAIRAGRAADAEPILTRGLAMFAQDTRPKLPGERALWLYKRGLARVNLNRLAEADVDLREALRADPVSWVRGRIHIELGKIADLASRRPDALNEYREARTACQAGNDGACVAEADRLLRRPFSMPPGKD